MAKIAALEIFPAPTLKRVWAYLLDLTLILVMQEIGMQMGGLLFGFIAYAQGVTVESAVFKVGAGQHFGFVFWGSVAWVLNFGVLQALTGASLGKKIFGIRVYQVTGGFLSVQGSLVRSLLIMLPPIPFHFLYGTVFLSGSRRGLHDWIAKSVVSERPPRIRLLLPQPVPQLPDRKAA